MNSYKKLFRFPKVYDMLGTNALFFDAVRNNTEWHYQNCAEYQEILDSLHFHPTMLLSYGDLHRLPPIPTLLLKEHRLLSISERKLHFKSTTSGTSGQPVEVGFDAGALPLGFTMLRRMLLHHKLLSCRPTNYLVLGYQPSKRNKMGAVRTAHAATFFAPALHREYALTDTGSDYMLNIEGVSKALMQYAAGKAPVRMIGFPAYFYFLLKKMERDNVSLKLPEKSFIFLGGGWKQFAAQQVDKREIYALAAEHLGITEDQIQEFYGVVEHNVPYFSCKNHHFHVPVYSRILIRHMKTMESLGYGEPGILNLITPILRSMPFTSILTDDIAILQDGSTCGCGNPSPYFEVLGRAGLQGIRTCAAGAGSMLEEAGV